MSRLAAYINILLEQNPPIGLSLAVIDQGEIAYTTAAGSFKGKLLHEKLPLPVASLTKPVFAYHVLQCCEQSLLDLDTPLVHYLPEPYLSNEPYLPFMTVRHALSHSTGFPNWRDEQGLKSSFCPGSAFTYSTEGLLYLQTVVEHLTKRPLAVSMQRDLFDRFGMTHSRLVPEDLSQWQPYLPAGLRAYGGLSLQTTAGDYARFVIQSFADDQLRPHSLDAKVLEEMMTPRIKVGDQEHLSWGLGWGIQHINNEDYFWHFGAKRIESGFTFNFAMGHRPTQSGIVVLTANTAGLQICEEIVRTIYGNEMSLPAFRWLLPPERWRADGKIL